MNPPTTCYMCDAPATSDEHVPPKGLFPKAKDLLPGEDLRKNLITVPSCDAHNTDKSGDDEYLMYALAFGIQNNKTAERQVQTKIVRALSRDPGVARLIAKHQHPVKVEDTATGAVQDTLALRIDTARFHQLMDHIGRALHFHHFGTKWRGEIQVIPLFLLALEGNVPQQFNSTLAVMGESVDQLLGSTPRIGANPDVFTFKVGKQGEQLAAVMLLAFYEGSKVVLLFKN